LFQISQRKARNGPGLTNPTNHHQNRDDDEVQELVLPDLLDHLVTSLEQINDHVGDEDGEEPGRLDVEFDRQTVEEHKGRRVGGAVSQKSVPVSPFFHPHPGRLPGEVADEVGGQKTDKRDDRDRHDPPPGCESRDDSLLAASIYLQHNSIKKLAQSD